MGEKYIKKFASAMADFFCFDDEIHLSYSLLEIILFSVEGLIP